MFRPFQKGTPVADRGLEPAPGRAAVSRPRPNSEDANVKVTVAALSIRESERFFGVRMAKRGMQPLWIEVVNHSSQPWRLDLANLDPAYYTPMEAAYVNHFSSGKRLFSYGLLGLYVLVC